jgi:hypothetical protein
VEIDEKEAKGTEEDQRALADVLRFIRAQAFADWQTSEDFVNTLPDSTMPMWAKIVAAKVYAREWQHREGYRKEWGWEVDGK